MALKTRGKLIALGIATFAASAALAFGTVAAAGNSGSEQPVLRITQDQNTGGLQQTQQIPQAPGGDARDCPFGHGSNGSGSNSNGNSGNGGTVNPGDV